MCFSDWQKTGKWEREKSGLLCPQSTAVSCVLPLLTDLVQCPLSYLSPNRSNSANKWASEWTLTGRQVLVHLKKEKASVGSPVSIFLFFSCFSRGFTNLTWPLSSDLAILSLSLSLSFSFFAFPGYKYRQVTSTFTLPPQTASFLSASFFLLLLLLSALLQFRGAAAVQIICPGKLLHISVSGLTR